MKLVTWTGCQWAMHWNTIGELCTLFGEGYRLMFTNVFFVSLFCKFITLQPGRGGRDIALNLTPQHSGRSVGLTLVMKLGP